MIWKGNCTNKSDGTAWCLSSLVPLIISGNRTEPWHWTRCIFKQGDLRIFCFPSHDYKINPCLSSRKENHPLFTWVDLFTSTKRCEIWASPSLSEWLGVHLLVFQRFALLACCVLFWTKAILLKGKFGQIGAPSPPSANSLRLRHWWMVAREGVHYKANGLQIFAAREARPVANWNDFMPATLSKNVPFHQNKYACSKVFVRMRKPASVRMCYGDHLLSFLLWLPSYLHGIRVVSLYLRTPEISARAEHGYECWKAFWKCTRGASGVGVRR